MSGPFSEPILRDIRPTSAVSALIVFFIFIGSDFNKSCGSRLTSASGWIRSPDTDGDGLYENNLDCWWIIVADIYQAITINITAMDIEGDVWCGYDYLKVTL